MNSAASRIGWYWFRTNFGRRRMNYLTIVLLVGAIGGLALGSVAAAGRTASSYNTFLASTNPSDLTFTVEAPNIAKDLAGLPLVKHVGISSYSVNAFVPRKNGMPTFSKALVNGTVTSSGSLVDEYFTQDRVALVSGRLPNPKKANEFMAAPAAATAMGWHVGQYIKMIFFTDAQA